MAEPTPVTGRHTFGVEGESFLLDGRPFIIRSGEMHYPRVPREYWRHRMRSMRAMGLNTLCTYVFWNAHEPEPGRFVFDGNLDLADYVRMAAEEGLWVLLRPGPYICTEWDFGGLPGWLLATTDMQVRSADPRFLEAASRYMMRVGQEVADLQIERGGPILMAQVENEYGSYGSDKVYLGAVRDMVRAAGFGGTLFTSDGSLDYMLAGGTLPDVLSVVNFGVGDPATEFANFAKFRQGVPRMCGEYWCGWFDHWGEEHHAAEPQPAADGVDWMLSQGISFNLYMVHGGTSFGYMAGANHSDVYQPDISSYDYDSPIDEAGRLTAKGRAMREAIAKHVDSSDWPPMPEQPRTVALPAFALTQSVDLRAMAGPSVRADDPLNFEAIGQSHGFVLYRHHVQAEVAGTMAGAIVRDFAHVIVNGGIVGTLDRRRPEEGHDLSLKPGDVLELLVENLGRVNFGPKLVDERKGLLGPVEVGGTRLVGWEMLPLPLDPVDFVDGVDAVDSGPVVRRGVFSSAEPADTFLDLRGWQMGHVWVNGHHLGRYWRIGPQQSLYLPAAFLRSGENEVLVLDLPGTSCRTLSGTADAVWETPGGE